VLRNRAVLVWALVLAAMNCCFYTAIDRLPLATVAAIEFLPVIVLAALGAHTRRNVAALALAVPGVYVLTGVHLAGEATGMRSRSPTRCCSRRYIVLRRPRRQAGARDRRARRRDGPGRVFVTPVGANAVDAIAILSGVGVGISSSVIPYVCDQLALERLPARTYSLMVALLPATATVIGLIVLAQVPTLSDLLGIGPRGRRRRRASAVAPQARRCCVSCGRPAPRCTRRR
jgi:inner membrane transporter RhtA